MIDKNRYEEYQNFLSAEPVDPPEDLSRKALNSVYRDLIPSHRIVFFKLLLVQSFIGFISLLFCPQFDLSLTNNYEVYHFFHKNFGQQVCLILCGGIFVGSGAIFASFLLSKAEIGIIRNSKILYYLSTSSLFLSAFMLFGVKIYVDLAIFWLVGAIFIGLFCFELSSIARIKLNKRHT